MIRRGFWLAAGAVTGIYGYRRVSALGRRLSASLNPPGPDQGAKPARRARQGHRSARRGHRVAVHAARETYRFTRDVREGMDLYMARHSRPAASTLSTDRDAVTRDAVTRDAVTRDAATRDAATRQSTTHEPEDGH